MADTVGDWLAAVHDAYPPQQAATWDNVGLQVGDADWTVERVLVTLDVTRTVLDEAASGPATLVLAHHPLLFRPLTTLTPSTPSGALALTAARTGVAVAAVHTNLDVTRDGAGTSDPVARLLGLTDLRPLTTELREGHRCKLVTFVPPSAIDEVLDAISGAGAGRIGSYERCAFRVAGTGTFRALEGSQPTIGAIDAVTETDEYRLEVELPRARIGAVVSAMVDAHPYEEVAYDLLPLLDGATVGFGLVGTLPRPYGLGELAEAIRRDLPAPHLRVAGDPARLLRNVAVVGGAGDGLIDAAIRSGADVYVTGDLRHHVTLDALEQGLALIDAGHHATESAALPHWIERLRALGADRDLTAAVVASRSPTVPWR